MRGAFARRADLAIDLGTSHVRVVSAGRGLVLEAPTAVAIRSGAGGREVVAVGDEAKKMLGRTPAGTEVVRPVRGGVVADFQATEALLRELIGRVGGRALMKPRVLVCIPSTLTEVERRAVLESTRAAGSRDVTLAPTPMAAAIGAGLPITEPVGSMIVDVGGGRTEVAVTSLGGTVVRRGDTIAGDTMDEALVTWLLREHDLVVGTTTAEQIKLRVGCAMPVQPPTTTRIRGRDMHEGAPREVDVTSDDAAVALASTVDKLRDLVLATLQDTPPELAADIIDRGIVLCGGAAQLGGLDHLLREATGLPVLLAEDPARCVARGAARLLDDDVLFERVAMGG